MPWIEYVHECLSVMDTYHHYKGGNITLQVLEAMFNSRTSK